MTPHAFTCPKCNKTFTPLDEDPTCPYCDKKKRRHKYNARKVTLEEYGLTFPSEGEAWRYLELKQKQDAGEIENLELQPRFLLLKGFTYNGKRIRPINYTADFLYIEPGNQRIVVEEYKGASSKDFPLRMKLFLSKYGDQYDYRIIK